jgi:hypothetical protein
LLRKIIRRLSFSVSFLLILPFFLLIFLFRHPLVAWALQITTQHGLINASNSLQSLIDMMNGNITSVSRAYLYNLSLDSFLVSPWLGAILGPDQVIGGHSEILDLLAGVGLIGFAGFIGGVWVIGRKAATGVFRISDKIRAHLWLQWLIFFILLSINTVFYSREIPLALCLSTAYILQAENNV